MVRGDEPGRDSDQAIWNRSKRCAGARGGARGHAKMLEDLGNHGGIYDGGDDRQGAAAVGALFNIDIEYPFEQPGPAQAGKRRSRGASAWSAEGYGR
jgi:hypothetical protein